MNGWQRSFHAGALGVALLDRMCSAGCITGCSDGPADSGFEVSELGMQAFADIGVDVESCQRARRQFARSCLDWTERRTHLAGALGAAVATAMLDRKWLRRIGTGRGLHVTEQGEQGLWAAFKIGSHAISATGVLRIPHGTAMR
jgi:hypothetical protein